MLPTIEFSLVADCKVRRDVFGSGEDNVLAYTFAYNFEEAKDAAKKAGDNLDGFLSKKILSGMHRNPVKSRLVFFYAPHPQYVFLSVTSREMKVKCPWMIPMVGRCSFGLEYIRANAKPYLHWDGKKLRRLYEKPPQFESNKKYISDLGASCGLIVGNVSKERYKGFVQNKAENWDYSAVPNDPEEVVKDDKKKLTLYHTWYSLD